MTPRTQLQLRLDALRERRAAAAATRAAFEERREHGLRARHQAKLAHLAARSSDNDEETEKEELATDDSTAEAAAATEATASGPQSPEAAAQVGEPAVDAPGADAA